MDLQRSIYGVKCLLTDFTQLDKKHVSFCSPQLRMNNTTKYNNMQPNPCPTAGSDVWNINYKIRASFSRSCRKAKLEKNKK